MIEDSLERSAGSESKPAPDNDEESAEEEEEDEESTDSDHEDVDAETVELIVDTLVDKGQRIPLTEGHASFARCVRGAFPDVNNATVTPVLTTFCDMAEEEDEHIASAYWGEPTLAEVNKTLEHMNYGLWLWRKSSSTPGAISLSSS